MTESKAKRPDGGYVFHGGCHGCTNPLRMCPGCKYMEPNWSLPDLNPYNRKRETERNIMILKAKKAAEEYEKGNRP